MISFFVRTIVMTAAIALSTILSGALMLATFGDLGIPAPKTDPLPWQIASWVIIAATLTWLAMRSRLSGWRLAVSLAILYFGISHFNSIIEARFFGLFTARQFWAITMTSFVADVLLALALLGIVRGLTPRQAGAWSVRLTPLRVAVGALAYLFIYFLAGILILPYVEQFYLDLGTIPPAGQVVAMQLLIRGPVFVALAALLAGMSGGSRRETVLEIGGALTLLGGIAMLIVPNPFIPDAPRWAHFVEVAWSNFAFGCFLGWLLTAPAPQGDTHAAVAPAA